MQPPWNDQAPVREELFGIERLEQHAQSLAAAQAISLHPPKVLSLHSRLNDNAAVLLAAYRASAAELESGRDVVPAAEWLLDNYHLIEEQIREIRDDLPPGYYRQLPKLATGPFAGYPRVFGLTWAFVAHTDSHFDPDVLRRFIAAYQRVQPLTIGELWAVAITLRIVLIENLRRLADQITAGREARQMADAMAGRMMASPEELTNFDADIAVNADQPLSERFAAQFAKRLRDQDPRTTPALGWLERRLRLQGTSIDEVVQHAQQRQGASNVTIRNVITSMRLVSDIDWAELFESVSLVDERLRDTSDFAAMDFPTRNLYRSAVEQLARGAKVSELDVVEQVLRAVAAAAPSGRDSDPGYHLIAEGRAALERAIGFRAPLRLRLSRFNIRLGAGGYVGAVVLVASALVGLALYALAAPDVSVFWLVAFATIAFLPATDLATALVNRAITWSFGAIILPGLELADGVPQSLRTLVVVPTLLTSEADLLEQIERLEVHHLAGIGGDLTFALLTDGVDAAQQTIESDATLLAVATQAIAALNSRYEATPGGSRFLLLHRRRLFNAGEGAWMGWERKRGKLHELNRLLRGATDTSFVAVGGIAPVVPADVRYVITLDADTRLPRDTAAKLIGKMAHPLNRPTFDPARQRVVKGYAILQPRVTPSLPIGREGSLYQKIFSGPAGIDPYAAAVSDVYQDLFGEGSYTGKGIYDVDAFEAALAGRVPENAMLSHDLFEGIFARAGLASDIEVVEDFPARYDVVAKRRHRWTRGDWQLLPWLLRQRNAIQAVPEIGRGKMLDNLRRSVQPPLVLAALALCWLLPLPMGSRGAAMVLASIAIPAFLPGLLSILPRRSDIRLHSHIRSLGSDLKIAAMQTALSIAFLADQAWRAGDAIVRTLVRLYATRRHLLEWTTAAQSSGGPRLNMIASYRGMAGGAALGGLLSSGALALAPSSWPLILPFLLLWLGAPALALHVSRSPSLPRRLAISEADARLLRLTARRTWRFFETFVTSSDNMLPPDNFQETPKPVVAHRTSPTNIGLYLLSAVAARDFGWAGMTETVERLEATFATLRQMPRFRGHFFNWYGTQDLQALEPRYVSSVDSGNLAGHLIVLANACEQWRDIDAPFDPRPGLRDTAELAREAFTLLQAVGGDAGQPLAATMDEIDAKLREAPISDSGLAVLKRLTTRAMEATRPIMPAQAHDDSLSAAFWIEALHKAVTEHIRDRLHRQPNAARSMRERLTSLANIARETALAMDFAFLVDPERRLLSIGYSIADNSLDQSCYDLLASEARLASFFAIAKGDVPTRHWFRLGRTATPMGSGSALVSWSGSMFEYLMPSLVMRAPAGSLLDQTNRLVVQRQRRYGASLNIPWGVSESAFNARDLEFTYQYSNFGVPGLGLKRGLSENIVIAPYATGLAVMADPRSAVSNFERLQSLGARGNYGFYDAVDFTRSRLPKGDTFAVVRNFMAHHQGMTIVGIANALQRGRMRERFHREPAIKACELLLQERMPRDVAVANPRTEEVREAAADAGYQPVMVRRLNPAIAGPPVTHLLSNGRYAVMLSASGAGYSRWRDIAITRWREDSTCDDWGSFVFLRDTQNGKIWSAGSQPIIGDPGHTEVVFGEDHAEFLHRDGSLATAMDVLVSGEDNGEVRRVSLTNSGRRSREIELTSYAELVLTGAAADNAHQAFAKMFVQTEYLPEFGALIARRRPRAHGEPQVWAAHFAVVEGESVAEPQYDTDRARFLGRGRSVAKAAAIIDDGKLSNTTGTVLDPIFALRQRVRIKPGKMARVAFWTLVAASQAELLDLVDKHHDRNAFDRARTLAWTQAQVQLRHLDIDAEEAADFQRLAAPILYADPRFRAPAAAIARGADSQAALWSQSISGDLPIVLLRIDEIEDMPQVRQLLRAHEYWRMKRLGVDLVIVNEHASSYLQDLQIAIEAAVRSAQSRPQFGDGPVPGSIYALRADLMSLEVRRLLQSSARVALIARRGAIADQLARLPELALPANTLPAALPVTRPTSPILNGDDLEFFNGTGGFDKDGREYVTILQGGSTTPAPWINVVANPHFGFQVAAEGGAYTWAENSRENQLTPWSNDPVADRSGEAVYVRDEETGALWCPTARPLPDAGNYVARHGFGYSRFEHEANGIALDLLHYVPLADPIKISRLTLRNLSDRPRRLSVTFYTEWVLGTSRGANGPFIASEIDAESGALLARNRWNIPFSRRVAFAALHGGHTGWTADRTEFLGRLGGLDAPSGLLAKARLSGTTGAGLDPCAALQRTIEIDVGETIEIVSFLGQTASVESARDLLARYRDNDLDAVLREVIDHWDAALGAVQVKTPDRALDVMMNGWLLYQTLVCRLWARSAFYQASGAYGFRDQLQDSMAIDWARPGERRHHLLRVAGRQFVEGDMQHWWLPHSGQGVRTRISDDRVWLPYAVATYVASSGDKAVLDEVVPFLEGPALEPGQHDAFFQPMIADESASLFEHCARALNQCLELTGEHGLPLIGTGDWNDGMNRVGEGGKGESVWLGWLLWRTLTLFAPLADNRDVGLAARWRTHASRLGDALENTAWDGEWYRRATFDDGTWLGSKDSDECRIDSIAQSWAVLSGAADPKRASQAMASLEKHLIRPEDGIALLFTPPFDKTPNDPGYIKGYPPGLRENGGQYTHAAMWVITAFAQLGEGNKAVDLLSLVNPVNHARTPKEVARYKVEPYVVAADVYSVAPHIGRGGWTWYSGSAALMYRAGLEGVLGIVRQDGFLKVTPRIPDGWPGFECSLKSDGAQFSIKVTRAASPQHISTASIDGIPVNGPDGSVSVTLDGRSHEVKICL